jgi:hypothetical protein
MGDFGCPLCPVSFRPKRRGTPRSGEIY